MHSDTKVQSTRSSTRSAIAEIVAAPGDPSAPSIRRRSGLKPYFIAESFAMSASADFQTRTIALNHGSGRVPALGFGTLIADAATTVSATRDALEAGFRHFNCAERYRNEREVGEALQARLAGGAIAREALFITTRLWNSNHRPERVAPAFAASLDRLGIDYLDLYLMHTPFAFQPGDEQDPRDANGNVIYDESVTLLDTWRAMEKLVDGGTCRAIGLSDISLDELRPLYEAARIKPAAVQVEAHAYLDIAALPQDAFDEIDRIETRQRYNEVVKTGSPGFIPRSR
jgi:diketogulonate reductase-like aldo/keto reductase